MSDSVIAPFMSGTTTVVRDPSGNDLRSTAQPGPTVPYPNFEFKYVLTGYPNTQIDVETLRDGQSIGTATLTSQAPTAMVTPSGPKLTADFKNSLLTYTDYEFIGGELFDTTIGTVAVWQIDFQPVPQPGETTIIGVESAVLL
jgi:hypothetical protein